MEIKILGLVLYKHGDEKRRGTRGRALLRKESSGMLGMNEERHGSLYKVTGVVIW